jgi:hypothetical protein
MATKRRTEGGKPSKIRFIMLEADLNDGDLSQLTDAITAALRPAPVQQRLLVSNGVSADRNDDSIEDVEAEVIEDEQPITRSTPARPKKTKSPEVLDLDLDTAVSFIDFATARNPTNDQKRYLVIAEWFKRHRETPAITMNHVYTCYRKIKWPTNIADFDAGLRALKGRKLMSRTAPGTYAINHLGTAEVDALHTES